MMLSRAAPSAAGPSVNSAAVVGPAMAQRRDHRGPAARGSGRPPVSETKPAIPHMMGNPGLAAQTRRELVDDERRDALGRSAVEELALLEHDRRRPSRSSDGSAR